MARARMLTMAGQSACGLGGIALWHWIRTAPSDPAPIGWTGFHQHLYAARKLHHPRYDIPCTIWLDITQRFIDVASFVYSARLFARSRSARGSKLDRSSCAYFWRASVCIHHSDNLLIVTSLSEPDYTGIEMCQRRRSVIFNGAYQKSNSNNNNNSSTNLKPI